ncbi:hypothetical protein YC2023_016813 [Brassica napus]
MRGTEERELERELETMAWVSGKGAREKMKGRFLSPVSIAHSSHRGRESRSRHGFKCNESEIMLKDRQHQRKKKMAFMCGTRRRRRRKRRKIQ